MTESIARLGSALRVSNRIAWLCTGAFMVGLVGFVALATRRDMLPLALGLVVIAIAVAVSFRWPLLALGVFAALIPIEEIGVIGGFATISRFAGIAFAVTYGLPRLGRMTLSVMPAAGWAYVAWCLVSIGWAIDSNPALAELITLVQLFVISVLVANFVIARPDGVRPVMWAYSLSATATALIGILAYATSDTRVAALEGQNPAQFAAVLLPALAFGLFEGLRGRQRVFGAAVAVITSLGILVSGTRGAWVAVAVLVLVFVLPQLSFRRRGIALALSAGVAFLVVSLPGLSDLVIGRIETAVSSGGAGRTDIWSVAATIYQSAPVVGVGYANFPVAYTPDVVRATGVVDYTKTGAGPHNFVVGTLVELGPLGLVLAVLLFIPLVIRRGWGPDAATVQAALASLLTLALFLDIVGNRKQVWLFVGMAAGLTYLRRRRAERAEPAPVAGTDPDPPLGAGPPGPRARMVWRR
jgi:O-antigen ligase